MPQISSNFILRSKLSNFERDSFKYLSDMRETPSDWIDEGHISYCNETHTHYVFNSLNSYDEDTGLWRPLLPNDIVNIEQFVKDHAVEVVETTDNLTDELASQLGLGRFVYVVDTQEVYYNTYDNTLDNRSEQLSEYNTISGWFKPLSPNAAGYITRTELTDIIDGVTPTDPDGDPFVRKSELPVYEGISQKDFEDYKEEVEETYVKKIDLPILDSEQYATKEEVEKVKASVSNNALATKTNAEKLDSYKKEVEDTYETKADASKTYATKTFVEDAQDGLKGQIAKTYETKADADAHKAEFEQYKKEVEETYETKADADAHKAEFEQYKKEVEETYAKPDDISSLLNTYAPSIDNKDKWVANPIAGNLAGKTGEEIGSEHYSYNAVFDQILFGDFIPTITNPSVQVSLKDDWNGGIAIDWYDEKNRIILVKAGSAGPDGADFYATNITDAIINYPEGLDLSSKYTNGLTTSDEQQISVGFCRIKDENGNWDYYKQEGNIYHVPSILEEGEYRYYMAAYFQKGSPALSNTNLTISEWDETQVVESEDYITIITSKPMYYNTPNGMVEKDLVMWGDEVVDYAELLPTCKLEQSFSIPRKIKSLSIWNDVAGDFAIVPLVYAKDDQGVVTNNLVPAYFNEVVEENGYYTYKYDSEAYGHRGAIKIKVVF